MNLGVYWRTSCTKADSEEVVEPGENNSLIDSKIYWKEGVF